MIDPSLKRIAGMHVCEDGSIALVWIAYDKDGDHCQLYDSCVMKREVPAVIAESINARGRWIPVAWNNKEMADQLLERGCKMIPEESDETDAIAEVTTRDIWERMRTKRFHVDKRLKDWAEEVQSATRDKNRIPRDSYPLVAATRYAIRRLSYARRLQPKRAALNKPRIAII